MDNYKEEFSFYAFEAMAWTPTINDSIIYATNQCKKLGFTAEQIEASKANVLSMVNKWGMAHINGVAA